MNTTFTNYAEKKAKQFLNLLQGYTKGIRITAILILLLMGVSNAWGKTIYLYTNGIGWPDSSAKIWVHAWGSGQDTDQQMTKVKDQLYKADIPDADTKVIFTRTQSTSTGVWDKEWNRVGEQSLNDETPCLKLTNWGTGTWGKISYDAHMYLDNSVANWSEATKEFMIGHSSYSNTYTMTNISNTKLYYLAFSDIWHGYWDYGFIGVTSHWGEYNNKDITNRIKDATKRTGTRGDQVINGTKLFVPENASNDANLTKNDLSGYSALNYTQTIKSAVKLAGKSYDDANSKATISVTSYYLTGNATSTKQSASISTSAKSTTISAARTATTTLTVGTVETGYQFDGWYTAATDGTKLSTSTTYTYYPKAATTVYARFSEITYSVQVKSADNNQGTVSPANVNAGQFTGVTITATPEIGYSFANWTATAGITITDPNSASTTITATKAGTVTANFEKAKTTTVYLKPNAAWKQANARFAVYYWANGDKNAWSDMANIDCNNEYYAAEVPSECSGFQFVRMNGSTSANNWDNDWNQTIDLKLPTNGKTMFDMNKGKVYLKPNSEWKSDGARFAAYFFSKNGETTTLAQWMSMFDAEDGTYYCEIPAGQPQSVIFCRMDPNNQTNGWENNSVWNQTVDLQLVDADIFTIENAHFGDKNKNATGSWNIIWSAPTYDVTLHSSAFGEYGIVYNNTKYFSPKSGSVTYQIPIDATIKIFSTPYSNAYNGDVTVTIGGSTQDYASESTLTVNCNMTLDDNYKTIGTHVVYLAVPNNGGDWISSTNTNNCLRALHNLHNPATDIAAGAVVTMTEAGRATIADVEHIFYRCVIPAGYNTIRFEKRKDDKTWDSNTDLATKRLFYEIPLNSINCYRLSGKEDNFFIGLWESAPGFDGDYRLLHVKAAGVSYPSDIIRKGTTEQTVSLHIYKEGAGDPYPKIELQKYNSETKAWDIVTTKMVKDISTIMNDSEKGAVWNFVVKVNNGDASVNYETDVERYTGDYYIRTNNAEGGWRNYTLSTNKMTFSSYAKAHSGFTHYFCRWIDIIDNSTEPGHNNNVKFIVANDYGAVLSNEYAGDNHTTTGGLLPEDANVRWAWDEVTNTPSRAYILGSYNDQAQRNENIVATYKTNSKKTLDDTENWIYEIDLEDVTLGTRLNTLQATYPSKAISVTFIDGKDEKTETIAAKTQTFAEDLLMITADPSNSSTYTVRVIYDFKINKTLVMLLPNQGAKTGVDVFIERTDQGDATQVAAAVMRDDPGYTIYATMKFTKEHLESTTTKTEWERLYYWVSFPFDVRISDVFGFGEYGKQWIMEYYDGAERAQKGYYEGSTFWKFITDTTGNNGILHANQGYVLALARSIANQGLFEHGNTYVRLYFPSMNTITSIDGEDPTEETPISLEPLNCDIPGREQYDSHWHLIGVPSFANRQHTITQDDFFYYYQYQPKDDTYKVTSAKDSQVEFKSLHAYFVQYAGAIDWKTTTILEPIQAKRNNDNVEKTYSLRLELQKDTTYADQTFVLLKEEGATEAFDMNIDLTKMMNAGNNLYTLAGEECIQVAGNVVPVQEMTIPVGVKLATDGEYTFRMPDGTEGMVVELIDYEANTTTNLLLDDYTVNLPTGSNETRFALSIKPEKTATNVGNIGGTMNDGQGVRKFIIDGKLYLQKDGMLYDAQGHIVR